MIDPSQARIVASISGGKDSAAMGLWLKEQGYEFESVFLDTGWEHPATYDYLRDVLDKAIGPIKWLSSDTGGMVEWIRHKTMFPSRLRRFCTERLKVHPMRDHLRARLLEDDPRPLLNTVGIRAQESEARAKLPEWEKWGMDARGASVDAWVWRPLRTWTEEDVIAIHKRHGLPPNPLYLMGANRVGCWPCIHSRKAEINLVARTDPGRIDLIRTLEGEIEEAARARSRARAEKPMPEGLEGDLLEVEMELRDPDSWRHRRSFFHGKQSSGDEAIDRVVEWASTDRGGAQFQLFDPLDNAANDGCMRWGMCEVEAPEKADPDLVTIAEPGA